MNDYGFRASQFLCWGCLGMLLLFAAGILVRPRPEMRIVWGTRHCLGVCQAAITVMCVVKFPFASNQNMRFFAQSLVLLVCLFRLGVGHFWQSADRVGQVVSCITGVFLTGVLSLYAQLLF